MLYLWIFGSAFAGLMWGIWIALASEPAEWWELLTAFGTVGAVMIALGLAFRDSYRQTKLRESIAVVYRGLVHVELNGLKSGIYSVRKNIHAITRSYYGGDRAAVRIANLRVQATRFKLDHALKNIGMVVNLNASDARNMSLIVGASFKVAITLEDWADHYEKQEASFEEFSEQFLSRLDELDQMLAELTWAPGA